MKNLSTTFRFMALAVMVTLIACSNEDEKKVNGEFSNGIFIVNEGVFQTGTGTITYYDSDSNILKQDIFEYVNNRPLGNIAQSMAVYNGKGYIVVNNAGKVEVVDAATFKSSGTITGLVNPCQFLAVNEGKAYISDWAGYVAVADLNSNTITKTIPAGTGPDAMLKSGNYIYVANTGGFGIDSTVTVIDFATDKVVKTLHVGAAPAGIVADGSGRIWILCKGIGFNGWPMEGDTPGRILSIDPVSLAITFSYEFDSDEVHPEKLVINKEKSMLYFLYNYGIYRFNITTGNALPEEIINRSFYSLGYENKSGYLYASDAKDYSGNGVVFRYKANDGTMVDSITAGIVPRGFVFPGQE